MDENLILYRGIALSPEEVDNVKQTIVTEGIQSHGRNWRMAIIDSRDRQLELFNNQSLSTDLTRPSKRVETEKGSYSEYIGAEEGVCACGDLLGASYYAIRHNVTTENTAPFVVKFEVPANKVVIDGRDFLYNFGLQEEGNENKKRVLSQIFGNKIGKYLDKAWSNQNQNYRIAMADLAIQDIEIIQAHAKNTMVVGGRFKTMFCSAFIAKLPVPANGILDILEPTLLPSSADITIDSFREL